VGEAPGGGPPGGPAPWQERARSFGAVAAGYTALRPGYPDDVVAFAVGGRAGHARALRVLDLAAGTGLLTGAIAAAGHDVVAVDPAAGMLARLADRLPGVAALEGSAEAIPLPDADVDVVTAAQAAHWFDPEPAAAELLRVLRPGGAVGLVWNLRDDRVAWSAALDALLAAEQVQRFTPRAVAGALARALDADLQVHEAVAVQHQTPEQVVAGLATRSYVATMAQPRRERFLGSVRELLHAHPDTRGREVVEVRHVSSAWRLVPR
jgi:SAM-dependent methyltransferase